MITILATIFVLGVLIFFHELGHFLVAKKSGIRVDKFSLGFPPTILSKKYGDTEYAIGLIPLGGYVKMAGENPDEEAKGEPWEFMSKPVWKRFLVIFAGPFMNFILAIGVLTGVYAIRGEVVDNMVVINEVQEDSPAAKAGMLPGDRIIEIDGITIESFRQMAEEIIYPKVEKPITITWDRDGSKLTSTLVTQSGWTFTGPKDSVQVGLIGINPRAIYERMNVFDAFTTGIEQSVFYVKMVFGFVWGLINRTIDASGIGGPIFISQLAGKTAKSGFGVLLEFMALLSVNLAVLNILPIPVLDGGHMVFLGIEKLKGSPVSIKARLIAQQVGLAFMLILIVFVTFNDITR